MPELPEVETIVRKLTRGEPAEAGLPTYPPLIGAEIIQAWGIGRIPYDRPFEPSPAPCPATGSNPSDGAGNTSF